MKLLALDTATEACSAALYIDGEIIQRYEIAPRKHSSLLLPMVDALIKEAGINKRDLDALAFGRGPGSFMGVRIAAGVTQGIAFALSLPVIPVSSLAAIAMVCHKEVGAAQVACAIDARMSEVYWGCYEINDTMIPRLIGEEAVLPPQKIALPDVSTTSDRWVGAGTGWASYQETMEPAVVQRLQSIQPECLPDANAIATIAVSMYENGESVSAAEAIPVYLRNKVAKTTREREQAKL